MDATVSPSTANTCTTMPRAGGERSPGVLVEDPVRVTVGEKEAVPRERGEAARVAADPRTEGVVNPLRAEPPHEFVVVDLASDLPRGDDEVLGHAGSYRRAVDKG